jgi:hypothetical protein
VLMIPANGMRDKTLAEQKVCPLDR